MAAQSAPQHIAKLFQDPHGALTIIVADEHGDRVQRVEEKVWVNLRLQRCEARACKLFREPCELHFALPRLDEIADCVFDADHTEVDSDTEGQRSKDPAKPLSSGLAP